MDCDELIALLQKLPKVTKVFIRSSTDNAYVPVLKVFEYQKREIYAYIDIQRGTHCNYPEGYRGAVDVTKNYLPMNKVV
jgi:hypothetical protein